MENLIGIEKVSTFNMILGHAASTSLAFLQGEVADSKPTRSRLGTSNHSQAYRSFEYFSFFYQKAKEAKLAKAPQVKDATLLKDLQGIIE